MKIAIDAMGGDLAPKAAIFGSLEAIKTSSEPLEIVLLGDEVLIKKELRDSIPKNINIINTTDNVSINDKSSTIVKTRPDSSLVKGITLLKQNDVHAFISAGNTGAIMSASLLLLGRIKGVKRPALAAYLPTQDRGKVLCDVGALNRFVRFELSASRFPGLFVCRSLTWYVGLLPSSVIFYECT